MKKIIKLSPFKNFCCTIGNLPSSYLASLTYYEIIMWLCEYLEKTVIPALNNNSEAVTELQNLFIELKSYVNNYFDNLDVQNEINTKLDKMVEDGTMEHIFNDFFLTSYTFSYNTINELIDDESLVDGNRCVTYGFYENNDGGGSKYQILKDLESNNINIFKLKNGLFAKLIVEQSINIKQLGAIGNNTFDNTAIIQHGLLLSEDIIIPEGTFKVSSIKLSKKHTIRGISKNKSIISGSTSDIIFNNEFTKEGYEECLLRDFTITGNNISTTGLLLSRKEGSIHDAWINIQNISIKRINGDGLYLGKAMREIYIDTLEISHCSRHGIFLDEGATDNVINNVVSHNNEQTGFYINGANNRFSNCKAYWNGRNNNADITNRKSGYYITSWANKFINCDAQENALYGFHLVNTNNIQIHSTSVDRNGLPMTDWNSASPSITYGSGIYIDNCNLVYITGIARDFRKYSAGQTQKYGIEIVNSKWFYIDIMFQHNEEDYKFTNCTEYDFRYNGRPKRFNGYKIPSNSDPLSNYINFLDSTNNFGYDFYSANSRFSFYSDNNNNFKIDCYDKASGSYTWQGTPINVDNNANITLGRNTKKMGFFGATPMAKPTVSGSATDLTTTMNILNNLTNTLASLGLITKT